MNMDVTPVWEKNDEAVKKYKIVLHQGGSRSSKTVSIMQHWLIKAMQGQKFNLTIYRQTMQNIKDSVLEDFSDLCEKYEIPVFPDISKNRPIQEYTIKNATIKFWGLDKPGKAHGKKQDYFWINEGMEVNLKAFNQIKMRTTRGGIIDYNPYDDTHWVFNLARRDDVVVIKSTVFDNPFVEETIVEEIKSYEPTPENIEKGTADAWSWEVYGLGNTAKLEGVIFENWDIVPDVPDYARYIGAGLDFGYTNDPSALVDVYLADNEIYLKLRYYVRGLVNASILPEDDSHVKRLTDLGMKESLIVADSSEPKSIDEIYKHGFYGIKGVEKGTDSVKFGIGVMKGYKIHITADSYELINEFKKYKWREDKEGNSLNEPLDKFNHAIDAARYLIMTELKKNEEVYIYDESIV